MRFFLSLRKSEENDDGTVTVSGIASSEATDAVGEIIKADAIRDALPDYFAHGSGPLREMHQLSAAGTVDVAEVNAAGETEITATVVDPIAVLKIKSGVYKGFSIGGKVLARDPTNRKVITKLRLNEISLVDRPCNPEAVFDVWKADGAEEQSMDPTAETTDTAETTVIETPAPVAATADVPAATTPVADVPPAVVTPDVPVVADVAAPVEPDAPVVAPVVEAADAVVAKAEPVDALARATAALDALEASVAKAAAGGDLAKGLYTVQRFADVISSIASIVSSCTCEADYEADNSPVPAKMRSWLLSGAALFKEMAVEEIDELVAEVTAQKAAASAALADDASGEALAKALGDNTALLAKLGERDEALAKLADRVEPLAKTVDALSARLAIVEAEPVPAKTGGTFMKAAPVSKEQDAPGTAAAAPAAALSGDDLAKAVAALSEDERTLLLLKAAHTRPIAVQR